MFYLFYFICYIILLKLLYLSQDSGTEDLLTAEFNESGDSSDDEVEEGDPADSDTEKDAVVFGSDDEGDELDFETDSDTDVGSDHEEDEEGSDDTEDEEDSDETEHEEDSYAAENDSENESEVGDDSEPAEVEAINRKSAMGKVLPDEKRKQDGKVLKSVIEQKIKNPKTHSEKNGKMKDTKTQLRNEKNKDKQLQTVKLKKNGASEKNAQVDGKTLKDDEDEYVEDSSDEEDIRNTVGNIPMKWYDDYPHIGYNWDGKRIVKPQKGDQLDNFLKRMEDPDFWRTIKDPQTGQDVVLSESDIQLITRIQKQKIPDAQFDEYAVSVNSYFYLFFFQSQLEN